MALDLAVAGDVFDVPYFVLSFFPRNVLDDGTELNQFLRILKPILTISFNHQSYSIYR